MQRRGFTLIEVIVSLGIIVMMLSVGLPAFTTFQRQQNVTMAAEGIRDAILETYNYALAPRAADEDSAGKPAGADYYRIVFRDDSTPQSIVIMEQSLASVGSGPVEPRSATWGTTLRTIPLPSGVHFCGFSPTNLAGGTGGIVYSISKGGKIVDLAGKESYQPLQIKVQHTVLPEEVRILDIRPETGQVSITAQQGGC